MFAKRQWGPFGADVEQQTSWDARYGDVDSNFLIAKGTMGMCTT